MDNEKERKKIYHAWKNMLYRCEKEDNKQYKDYGGRGITVCEEWQVFDNFFRWSIENGHKMNLGIDRIDNNKGYCPLNCKWSTRLEQQNNRRYNHSIEIDGVYKTAQEWCEYYDINYMTFTTRVNVMKWGLVESITTPVRGKNAKGFKPLTIKNNKKKY